MKKVLFIVILLLAVGLRFAMLSLVPPSASLDEVTIGYNAYSILHTGKDEYGYAMPLLLRAYDDYRPATYVYLVVPFVKMFGLNVFSVRLPSVILSIITVIMSFFLVKNLFPLFKKKETIAFLTMFLLAISPWHIYISRLGHEVNLGLTMSVLSILLFLIAVNKKNKALLLTAFCSFGLSFYTYQSEKGFIPLILFSLLILFWKYLFNNKKTVVIGLVLFVVISLPMFFASISPEGLIRLKGTSIFDNNPAYIISAKRILAAKEKGDIFGEIANNRRIVTAEIFLQNYVSHFNPKWLFSNTGDEPFKAPNTGLMYLWTAPFLLVGLLYILLSKSIEKKIKIFLLFWLLADFVAPGLTTQAPHAMRAYTLLPLPQIITALGLVWMMGRVKNFSPSIAYGFILLLSVVAIQELYQFAYNYFIVFPINQSESFQYALTRAIPYAITNHTKYNQVVISNRDNLFQSYMFYLFYSQYDPATYLSAGGTKSGGFGKTHVIDNIVFRPINFSTEKSGTLLIGNSTRLPAKKPLLVTYYLDGTKGVTILKK